MSHARLMAALAVSLVLAACGNSETLLPYPAANPAAVSFAGNWQLRGDARKIERAIDRAIRQTDGVRDNVMPSRAAGQSGRGGQSRRSKGGLAHVFLKNGESLKITQTPSALFISFNRAIVEEYRFGELREIRTGQAEAMRASGWAGSDYVIDTLDRQGMKLSERYDLSSDRETLTRHIEFRARNKETVSVVQTFARVE